MRTSLITRLQVGPGMRVQRALEAGLLIAGISTGDVRFAWVTGIFVALQAISPWLVPVALPIAVLYRRSKRSALGDLYYDLGGTRGSAAVSVIVHAVGLFSIHLGYEAAGWIMLAMPAASFLLSATVGFCTGCTFYVWFRNVFARLGLTARVVHGACDINIDERTSGYQQ